MIQCKYLTISASNIDVCIKQIADESGLDVELVAVEVKKLFHELEKLGALEDGKIMVSYSVPDMREKLYAMNMRLQKEIDIMCYFEPVELFDKQQQRPPFIEKLHRYRKHECHRKPNHWHRIRSNPRQR